MSENSQPKKKNKRLHKDIKDILFYRKALDFLSGDAPIEVLCLGARVDNALKKAGILRVYDLIDADLTKIERIGPRNRDLIAARVQQFLAIHI